MRSKLLSVLVLLFVLIAVLPVQAPARAASIPQPVGLTVEPKQVTLQAGQTCQIKTVVIFSDGKTIDATRNGVWYVSNSRVVSFRYGQVTALSPGTAAIQVRSYGRTGVVSVRVVPKAAQSSASPAAKTPVGITVEPRQVALEVGQTGQVRVALRYADGTTRDVTGEAVYCVIGGRNVVSVNKGRITALAPGSVLVQAISQGRAAAVGVTVRPRAARPVAVSVEPASLTLDVGESAQLRVTLKLDDGTTKDVTGEAVCYVIGDKSVVAVDKGRITALKPGQVLVQAISQGLANVARVTVVQPRQEDSAPSGDNGSAPAQPPDQGASAPQPPAADAVGAVAFELVPSKLTMREGEAREIRVVARYADGREEDITGQATSWGVSNTGVLGVQPGRVQARKPGKAQVVAVVQKKVLLADVEVLPLIADRVESGEVPPVEVAGQAVAKEYRWQYLDKTYSWRVQIPQDLIDWSEAVYRTTEEFFGCQDRSQQEQMLAQMTPEMKTLVLAASTLTGEGNYVPLAKDARSSAYIAILAAKLQERARAGGFDRFATAEFVQKFVQSLPFRTVRWPELPARVLVNGGDCDGRSVLYAALMRAMGYDVALIYYSAKANGTSAAHMNAGIALPAEEVTQRGYPVRYYEYGGRKYYLVELTAKGRLGESYPFKATAIYPVN